MTSSAKARTHGSYLNLTDEKSIALKEFWVLVLDRLNDNTIISKEVEPSKNGTFSKWMLKGISGGRSSEDFNELRVSTKTGNELKISLSKLIRSDHADVKAIKYLIARSWKVKEAYKMFINSLDFFSKEIHDQVKLEGERILNINRLNSNEGFYYQYSKDGNLILYIWGCRVFSSNYTSDENLKFILNELNVYYLMLGEHSNIDIVFNMNGLTLANIDMSYLRMLTKTLSDHYPEVLHRVLIHDAPWIFNSAWSMICTFLDPNIKSKVIFTQKDQIKDYIEEKSLPTDFGGFDKVKFEYYPPGDNEALATPKDDNYNLLISQREELFDKFLEYTQNLVKFNTEESKVQRNELADQLALINIQLSEYEYSPSIYHRMKVIEDYDTINWKVFSTE